ERVRHYQGSRGRHHHGHQVHSRPDRVAQAGMARDTDRADGHQRVDHDIGEADDGADQELKRHRPLSFRPVAEGPASSGGDCVYAFGVKAPPIAFIADSPMPLAWSVSARIWSWKNSDWILSASCMSLAWTSLSPRSKVAETLRCIWLQNSLA